MFKISLEGEKTGEEERVKLQRAGDLMVTPVQLIPVELHGAETESP